MSCGPTVPPSFWFHCVQRQKVKWKCLFYLRAPPLIWCRRPVWKATTGCRQDCTSKSRLWADILHAQRSRQELNTSTERHLRVLKLTRVLTLIYEYWVPYRSPWTGPAMAGCGGDRDTEWRAAQAERPAPDSNLSSHILVWACTVASADRNTNNMQS